LTHILGYCELWLEDAETYFLDSFLDDLRTVHELGQLMLARLDEIVHLLERARTANLDRSANAPETVPRPRAAHAEKRSETGAVLVVDDDAYNRDLLSRLLRRDGHTVFCAADVQQAMAMMASQFFDLILLDIHMPDSDGVQALAALKAD